MKGTIKTTVTTLLRTGLIIGIFAALSGCGQKGPLVLEQVPVDQTQAPLENATDRIPVETPKSNATEETTPAE